MQIQYDAAFARSLHKLEDKNIKSKLIALINEIEHTSSLLDIKNVKKIQGFKKFYRIRIGDYRIGIELINSKTVLFITVAHRKDIYKKFP